MRATQISKKQFPFLGFGLGLRSPHYPQILSANSQAQWFEALSENYLGLQGEDNGPPLQKLLRAREHYSVVLHGVSMSLGGTDPFDDIYFKKLKELIQLVEPEWVSDHLCWTSVQGKNSHDLLPLPYTEESIRHLGNRIREAQDRLERPMIVENVSSYAEFDFNQMSEAEFVAAVAEEANCGLLLDVNNIYVSSYNHQYSAEEYLDKVPWERVVQVHLAGHRDRGKYLLDTHDAPVCEEVWELYQEVIRRAGSVSTMIERDDNIPPIEELETEMRKARQIHDNEVNSSSRLANSVL